ncbi:uncharacterized protein LOC129725807 [Wyeomyia smithii]|uniref:uncharacterized protein LOC129725807 n=1 Tax=Wyeomyia smithii TaxID=174621 RepID=UPI0024680A1A|nr:uncharacterized protein LOC129725807 [Wyeomyia smithii]
MSLVNMTQLSAVKNGRNRTLDLVFVNDESVLNCAIAEACDSLVGIDPHHPPLSVSLACPQLIRFEELSEIRQLNFSKSDFEGLQRALLAINWENLLNRATDVDSVVEIFTHTMKQQFTNFVPSFHPRPKPVWSNRRLRELKRQRAAALRKYVRRRNAMTKLSFTTASSHYKTYNRFLYAQHVLRTQSQLKRNPKRFWSFVNSKRKESGLPSNMFLRNDSADTLDGIGSLFRKHFSSIFNSSSANTAQIQSALRDVPHNVVNLSNICFSDEDVLKATEKLKPSSSAGPDGIPAIILKRCAIALCVPLRIIFNKSLSLGVFPDCWKKSAMFPVYKKGNKHDIVNYRGITLLSAGSKLFEILVGNV